MDVALWIFITAGCLTSACVGAIAAHLATRWSMQRQLEVVSERKDTAVEAAMGTAFELQRVSGDQPAVELYDQDLDRTKRTYSLDEIIAEQRFTQAELDAADERDEQRLCDNRCGTPARWVWDDGAPHAACDGCVDLWWPDGIDLLVVTDLEATGDACPGCGGTLMTLDDGSRWCPQCTSFCDRPDIGSWPELADPDTPDTAPRTVPGTRLD